MNRWAVSTIFAWCSFVVSIIYHFFSEIDLKSLCEYEAKPVIFGDHACSDIFDGRIAIKEGGLVNSLLSRISHKFIVKGVMTERNGESVYLKKLATSTETEFADLLFASTFKNVELNRMAIPLVKIEILKNVINHEPTSLYYNGVQKLTFCPKLNKIDQLLVHVPGFEFDNVISYVEVWTSVLLNAEPLILQILQPPVWPVPRYYGSCGRLTVVEDCGTMLTHFVDHPWKVRARLAAQLLQAAINFTFGHPELAFYLTDASPDNIAVDRAGNVRFIDLEHVIIVEKNPPLTEQPLDWHLNHSSTYFPCDNCYSFSVEEICDHRASDFNVLAVCMEILHNTSVLFPEGFLHSVPSQMKSVRNSLPNLLSQCVENTIFNDRFTIANDIIKLIVKHLT